MPKKEGRRGGGGGGVGLIEHEHKIKIMITTNILLSAYTDCFQRFTILNL